MMMAAQMARRPVQSGEMLSQLERHKIQVLLEAGHTTTDVAQRCSASLDTVRRVQREIAVVHTDDSRVHRERRIGRPSKSAPFTEKIVAWLPGRAAN